MKKPTETLEAEHRIIEKILGAMARLVDVMETSQEASSADIAAMVEFVRTFADGCHHGKEEKLLFPALEHKGLWR